MASPDEAAKILDSMKTASETVRSAVINAIPVAPNQVLTVSVPGVMINWKDFYYDADQNIKAPLAVQVKEARLVDGMIPLSKYTAGKTGKSVARSYLSALDLLVPVEASVSGVIGNNPAQIKDPRLKVIKDRYEAAMNYLRSPDEGAGSDGRSKVDTYVMKQAAWAREVSAYAQAQGQALEAYKPPSSAGLSKDQIEKNLKDSREKYMQWIQEHGRDFKNTIQTKYMDWVVHGYKFMVDYNFGIVDIASGMKRIENSKEAFRNLTLIAEDGASEYQTVILTPSDWATIVRDKTINWQQRNNKPTAAEIRAELRRLKNLLISHQTLDDGITNDYFYPVMSKNSDNGNAALQKAYAEVYSTIDDQNADAMKDTNKVTPENKSKWQSKYPLEKNQGGAPESNEEKQGVAPENVEGEQGGTPENAEVQKGGAPAKAKGQAGSKDQGKTAFQKLAEAQAQWNEKSLSRNNATIRQNQKDAKDTAKSWLAARIGQLKADIKLLEEQLGMKTGSESKLLGLPVVNEQGIVVDDTQVAADPVLSGKENPDDPNTKRADPWTRISCKASRKKDEKATETSESSSSVAAAGGWGLFSASGGFTYSESSAKAMQKMSNLDVEITMDCMVVEIDRPWLHAELFADAELDSGRFDISPGEESLKGYYDKGQQVPGFYQQFSSFPTAFVVAADVELSFSGDTTELESAMSASSMSANVSVGYGPFALSASHSNSKSKSKTKMESTATGCKISIQAPQIVGWVQNLLPQLPKPRDGISTMVGLFQ